MIWAIQMGKDQKRRKRRRKVQRRKKEERKKKRENLSSMAGLLAEPDTAIPLLTRVSSTNLPRRGCRTLSYARPIRALQDFWPGLLWMIFWKNTARKCFFHNFCLWTRPLLSSSRSLRGVPFSKNSDMFFFKVHRTEKIKAMEKATSWWSLGAQHRRRNPLMSWSIGRLRRSSKTCGTPGWQRTESTSRHPETSKRQAEAMSLNGSTKLGERWAGADQEGILQVRDFQNLPEILWAHGLTEPESKHRFSSSRGWNERRKKKFLKK